ncbi:hypothetical protein B0H10DRAFT_1949187 [Mycena sp. CBHHK59/15]|nr:hypothetical protein B0H10DRAFT_1949187 [Mycena sp. CBHHK59/15]
MYAELNSDLEKPLFVVSAGDLGATPPQLNSTLIKIFFVVPEWNAIVLIDEFMQRTPVYSWRNEVMLMSHEMPWLRCFYARYFKGIIFLTTNRVRNMDQAIQSRIDLLPHYKDLTPAARE